jgi:ferric hydroxamate transport system substrate-binding protein
MRTALNLSTKRAAAATRAAIGLLALALALLAAAPPAHAAPKRVVALEWDALESLAVLGVRPVGGADLRGYREYVAVPLPGGIADVGTRQQPSLERIAKLRPDLIVVPGFRAGRNLATLRKIAPVLVTNPYAAGSQFTAMVGNFRRIAAAVGRKGQGERVLRVMSATLAASKARLRRGHRAGLSITIATPGGTTGSPSARLFTRNSAVSGTLERMGLRNAWTVRAEPFGFSTVGVEALRRVQGGWLSFVYPSRFREEVLRFTGQPAYRRLAMVRANRVRRLAGNTWLFGGPRSVEIFAQRLTDKLLLRG